jgi:hypothetical protein
MKRPLKENVSRQCIHSRKLRMLGLCLRCGKPSGGHVFCEHCRVKVRNSKRQKTGCKAWQPGGSGRPPIGVNVARRLRFKNHTKFNCCNYVRMHAVRPNNCYNCMNRDGYPQNIGGDEDCLNFKPVGREAGL